ncbi:hypothetical protein FHS85_001883 [Rhodoligotrophos appendicifer]|uniref:hypothetical protein n=1 Tax=Rhodoligotrophos appendicifer TaxID=987056 RepID=UPI0019607E96|nr:hypothetical protein [Rhodoligotrophos appendicifer]
MMVLRNLVKQQVVNAFESIGYLVESITYKHVTLGAYDPTSDTVATTVQTFTIPAVLVQFKLTELDTSIIVQTDRKCLIPALSLPITPTENDQIIALGRTWNVQAILGVPGASFHILHTREV